MKTEIEEPCPFCDSTEINVVENDSTDEFCLICRECQACGPITDSKLSAIRTWNERA